MITLLFTLLIVGLLIGMPVFIALGLSTFAPYFIDGHELVLISLSQRTFSGIARFELLAVPMFILAGKIMEVSGIMDRLLGVANVVVGRITGGLAQVNIVASMLFAGISGSAIADTVALGAVLIPGMKKEGYEPGFAGAVTAASAIVGPIIPPSQVMIIYGAAFGLSISSLFAAGMFPGIFVGVSLMVVTFIISVRSNHPKREKMDFKKAINLLIRGIIPLTMPVIILGGIFSGFFTATEASAVAVFYALIIGYFVYREITFKKLAILAFSSAKTCAGTVLILGFSTNFSWILSRNMVPQHLLQSVMAITDHRILLLLLINLFLFGVGLFVGRTPALLILGPMLIPIMEAIGLHPLHIAMIIIFALGVGHLTPPFGMLLFTSAYAGRVKITDIISSVPIYVVVLLLINMIVTFIPEFVMFFPRMLGFV